MPRTILIRHLVLALAAAFLLSLSTAAQASLSTAAQSRAESAPRLTAKPRFARLDGMRVHYESAGKGSEALVFIHGWTCNANFWRRQMPDFERRMRVIALDLPGHGRSDKPQEVAYTMDLFARAVEAVMRDAGVRRAVLVGHSMGTPVARQFYRKYPEKTLAVVIVDGGLRPFAPREVMEKYVAPMRGEKFREGLTQMVGGMLAPVADAALREEIRSTMLSAPQHVAVGAMDAMLDETIWKKDRITVPVLAILAASPFWPPDNEQFFREIAPTLDYRMWTGVSHFLMMEKPAEFNRELGAFLARRRLLKQK